MLLENMSTIDVRDARPAERIVLLPLGSFEQHGPHLPLTVDSDIVTAVARAVERERAETVLCLPTVWTGHSTHHLFFPGTMSVSQMHYIRLITDLCESIHKMGGRKVFLLNGHGGNDIPVRAALRELKDTFPDKETHLVFASYWMLAGGRLRQLRESEPGGMGHACELETSLMLHLHPDRVRMDRARSDGPSHPPPYRRGDLLQGKPVYYVSEFHELSESGVIGRPDLATAEKGRIFLEAIVSDVVAFVDDFAAW